MPTLGIRLQPHLEDTKVDLDSISVVRPPECPPWLLQQPNMLTDQRKTIEEACPLSVMIMNLAVVRINNDASICTPELLEIEAIAIEYI